MTNPPAYQYYAADFDEDTASWECDEVGIYQRLLNYSWINGWKPNEGLPDDLKRLARIARCSYKKFQKGWTIISKKFFLNGNGFLINRRLEEQRTITLTWRKKSKEGGKRSARLRAAKRKGTHTEEQWLLLISAANSVCPRCKSITGHFDKDHVIPIYQGGSDSIENIQPLCAKCNSQKGPERTDYFKEQRLRVIQPPLQPPLQPKGQPKGNSSSSSSSSIKDKRKNIKKESLNQIQQESFNLFWKAYPYKKSIGQAEKAWKKINPDEGLLTTMLTKIEKAKKSKEWLKDNGEYIPHPATWLNAKGWEDEDVEVTGGQTQGTRMACKKCGDNGQYAGIDESGLCTSCRIK